MDVAKLEHLERVARAGGYQPAQRRSGVPAATLKLAVSALEEELGCRLFDRVGRGVRITAAGRRLLRAVDRIRGELEAVRHDLGAREGPLVEPVRFAAQESYVLYFLPPRLRSFLRDHPEASFDIRHDRAAEVARRVAEGEVEFGLANDPARGFPAVAAHARFRLRPLLILARDARPPRGLPALEALSTLPLILPDRRSEGRRRLDAAFRERGLRPRIVMETGGYSLIRKYVEVGLGASVIPDLAVGPGDRTRFRWYDLTGILGERRGYVLLRRRRPLSRGAAMFLKVLDPGFRPPW